MSALAAVLLFNIMAVFVVLVPAAFGSLLLFASGDRLYRIMRRLPLPPPLPDKGTRLYIVLLTFWRVIGIICLSFALLMAFTL